MAHEAVRFYAQRSFDILVVMLSRTAARGLRHRATVARSSVRIFSATSGEDLPPPSPDDERYKFKSDDVCNPVAEYNTDNLNDFAYPTTFPSPWKVEHWKRVYGEIKDGETEEEFRRRVPNMWSPESRAGEGVDVPYRSFDPENMQVYGEIKDGETEEEFRRRVPNMWSPESRAGEVVDVLYRSFDPENMQVYGEIKDGETEEEFRRRVPNMWSPESRAGEVVDVPYLHRWFEFNHGPGMWQHTFFEPGMVKAAPDYDPDWTPLGSKSARKKKEDEL